MHNPRLVFVAICGVILAACAVDDAAPAEVDSASGDSTPFQDTTADTVAPRDSAGDTAPDAQDSGGHDSVSAETTTPPPDTTPAREIDPNGDSDGDGVFDLDELSDGTDPFDPRSARAWNPEMVGHPRLFMGPDDVATVAARKDVAGSAHAVLWRRVLSESDRAAPELPSDGTYDGGISVRRAVIAENAAFRGLLDDNASYLAKAAELIAAPAPDATYLNERSNVYVDGHYNLHESEALVALCTAWDYLAGAPDVAEEVLSAARDGLAKRIAAFKAICFEPGGCRTFLGNERNNHALKPLGALGLCAMALPDRPDAAEDFNEAITGIDFLLNRRQGASDGAYAENWNYLNYGGQTFEQLLLAWHRVADGASWLLHGEGVITREDPYAGTIREYADFGVNPRTHTIYLNMIKAARPDGLTVPIDDGNPSAAHGGLLSALFDDGRFLWNWELPRVGRSTGRTLTATLAMLDPELTAEAPDWPLDFFDAEAGFSVMRTSFDDDQLYVHFNHEKGPARSNGGAHEHADNLSIVLHAFGEPLIIDPGYLDYSNHKKVKYGSDHNLIMVDGEGPPFSVFDAIVEGPPLTDAYLHDHDAADGFTTAIGSSKYLDAEVRRRVLRIGDRFVVVADAMLSAEARTYQARWNGYAGGTVPNSTWTPRADGGRWDRTAASLVAVVAPTVAAATYGELLEDSQNDDGRRQHVCLTVEATMGAGAGFLTVLSPHAAGEAEAAVTSTAVQPGVVAITIGDGADKELVALNLTDAAATMSGATLPVGLSWQRLDDVESTRTWTMETPPIPDPPAIP